MDHRDSECPWSRSRESVLGEIWPGVRHMRDQSLHVHCFQRSTCPVGLGLMTRNPRSDTSLRGSVVFILIQMEYYFTSMPMLRADPSTVLIAASMSCALRSAIFFSAISRTCALVTEPTFL